MNRAHASIVLLLVTFLVSCTVPSNCPGNCETVCAGKMFEAGQCAAEYKRGFNVGYCAGMLNVDRRGDEPMGPFLAGYWDGYSEGSYLRLDWYMETCARDAQVSEPAQVFLSRAS